MNKLNRTIDETRMNLNKEKTIDFVMNSIDVKKKRSISIRPKYLISASLTMFLIAMMFVLNTGNGDQIFEPIELNAQSVTRISEVTYMTGNLMAAQINLSSNNLRLLSDTETTALEDNLDEFNYYFDMLKVFLEEEPIDQVVVIPFEGEAFDQTITYYVEDVLYTFNVKIVDDTITGELIIDNILYEVSGTYEEKEEDTELELISRNGDNYVKLKYETKNTTEFKHEYHIESSMNGIYSEKEISIKKEGNEAKVEIHENENEFELKRELEDGVIKYKLEYKLGEQEGEAVIIETEVDGVKNYAYSIEENGKQKDIDKEEPGHFRKHNDDEEEED